MLRSKRFELVRGPGDRLNLGPIPAGKSHTLVLDIDKTIAIFCFSEEAEEKNEEEISAVNGSQNNDVGVPSRKPDASIVLGAERKKQHVEVWYRPHLMEFLATISEKYEIVVFSSGDKRYVEWIISKIDPNKEYVSTVYSCEELSTYQTPNEPGSDSQPMKITVKNIIGFFKGPHPRHPERLVCVDDQFMYHAYNLGNLVPIRAFEGDADDGHLMEICSFLMSLIEARDVRDEIRKRCNLPADVGAGF